MAKGKTSLISTTVSDMNVVEVEMISRLIPASNPHLNHLGATAPGGA